MINFLLGIGGFAIFAVFLIFWLFRETDDFFQILDDGPFQYCCWSRDQTQCRHSEFLSDIIGVPFHGKKLIMYITTFNKEIIEAIGEISNGEKTNIRLTIKKLGLNVSISKKKNLFFIFFEHINKNNNEYGFLDKLPFPIWIKENNEIIFINEEMKKMSKSKEDIEKISNSKNYEKFTGEQIINIGNVIWCIKKKQTTNFEINYLQQSENIVVLHKLDESKKLLMNVINQIDLGVMVFDKHGTIKVINNSLCKLFNLEKIEGDSLNLNDFLSLVRNSGNFPELSNYKNEKEKFLKKINNNEIIEGEFLQTLDGRCFFSEITQIDENLKIMTYKEISENLKNQRENRNLGVINNFIQDNINEGFIIFDKDKKTIFSNGKIKNFLGEIPSCYNEFNSLMKNTNNEKIFVSINKRDILNNRFILENINVDNQKIFLLKPLVNNENKKFEEFITNIRNECVDQIDSFFKTAFIFRGKMDEIHLKERFRILEKNIFNIKIFLLKVWDMYCLEKKEEKRINFTEIFSKTLLKFAEVFSLKNIEINYNSLLEINLDCDNKYLERGIEYILHYLTVDYSYKKEIIIKKEDNNLNIFINFFTNKNLIDDFDFMNMYGVLEKCFLISGFSILFLTKEKYISIQIKKELFHEKNNETIIENSFSKQA